MEDTITNITTKPRLAFLGTGWIGLNRMKALLEDDACMAAGIYDTSEINALQAKETAPEAMLHASVEDLIANRPDGVVIATPNALHYEQCLIALNRGIPVFCQKPLARTLIECNDIISTARRVNKLLGVDLSYRYTDGMQKIFNLIRSGELGEIYAVDLTFHNAYGPDKDWFYNPQLSGGGCVIDLGIHLVDLALWVMDFPHVKVKSSSLYSGGKKITMAHNVCEDFATAHLETDQGASIRLTCSWNLNAGRDAEIKAAFYGNKAAAVFENVHGSFYDFQAYLLHGTTGKLMSSPPDDWGGKALSRWLKNLIQSFEYNTESDSYSVVAETIDKIYGRAKQV